VREDVAMACPTKLPVSRVISLQIAWWMLIIACREEVTRWHCCYCRGAEMPFAEIREATEARGAISEAWSRKPTGPNGQRK
jgi:hypothetical protein